MVVDPTYLLNLREAPWLTGYPADDEELGFDVCLRRSDDRPGDSRVACVSWGLSGPRRNFFSFSREYRLDHHGDDPPTPKRRRDRRRRTTSEKRISTGTGVVAAIRARDLSDLPIDVFETPGLAGCSDELAASLEGYDAVVFADP